jgi:hypothetical protein
LWGFFYFHRAPVVVFYFFTNFSTSLHSHLRNPIVLD